MDKILERLEQYILYILIFLLPITALAISPNPFVVSKLALLAFGLSALLLVRVTRILSSGKLELSIGKYDIPVALLALSYIVSTIFRTPNKMEALLLPGTTTAVISGSLVYFFLNQLKPSAKRNVAIALSASAVAFSILTLFAFSGLFEKIPQLPAYVKARNFTPEGGFLPGLIFLTTILPVSVGLLLSEKNNLKKALFGVVTTVLIFALAVSIYNVLPGKQFTPRFPSVNVSWQIAIEALKESPLMGVGPGNYLTAFNRFRPLFYNFTDLWAVKFSTASNYYFSLLTETGIFGLFAIAILLFAVYKDAKREFKEQKLVNWGFAGVANLIALTLSIIFFAVFPATTLLLIIFFIYLSLNTKTRHTAMSLITQSNDDNDVKSRFPAFLVSLPIAVLVVYFLLQTVQVLRAEYTFKKSLDALVRNDAQATHDLMRDAITINNRVDRYHATFSRINLLLANATTQNATQRMTAEGANAQITEDERQQITILIQQAISEGKATVALNPMRAGNWEILARTYQAITPFAQGADTFAAQSFSQAIALDPLNPNLRIALGGIYYAKKDYNNAVQIFNLVANTVKPNLANAHYNLAFALREKGELDAAIREITTVMALIEDKNSQDYKVASQALEDLQSKQKEIAKEGTDNLTPPQESVKQVLTPPLELPEDAEPPEAPLSPTPIEVAEVSPTAVLPSPTLLP